MDEQTCPVNFSCVDGSIKFVTNDTSSIVSYVTGVSGLNIPAQEKFFGQNLILTSERPQKTGHYFAGWSTTPNAVVPEYEPVAVYSVDEDVTLYAVWYEIESGIFNISAQPDSVNISVSCSGKADLVVAVYDCEGKMLYTDVETLTDVYYDNVSLPLGSVTESAYIKVFLLNSNTHEPLCEAHATSL